MERPADGVSSSMDDMTTNSAYAPSAKTTPAHSSNPLTHRQLHTKRGTEDFPSLRKATFITLSIVAFQLCLTAIFVAYVWSHIVSRDNSTIWVTIPNNTLLLISTIISRVPPTIVPLVMGLAAYGFASDWLVSSAAPDQNLGPPAPTPEQYSIALKVIGGADLGAVVAAVKYLFRKPDPNVPVPLHPRWLTTSIIFLLGLTFLAYLVAGIDLWFHKSVLSVYLTTFATSRTPTTSFSRSVNSTFCALQKNATLFEHPCTSITQGAQSPFILGASEGLATATNTSSINEVILLPNSSIALLLPAYSLRSQHAYQATTIGTYATCAPISLECSLYPVSGASTPYACVEHPAFVGDMNVVPLPASVLASFNESGTRMVGLGPSDLGASSQPLELGVAALLQSGEASFVSSPPPLSLTHLSLQSAI
jgi:hypothetical protein